MDHMTFRTRAAALEEIETMLGWDAKPDQLVLPGDPNADEEGNAWVVRIDDHGDPKYLRRDGYVR